MQRTAKTHDEMLQLGVKLGQIAPAGTCVALRGTLGAGKTVFAKGVGAGLGVTQNITSPTFVLMNVYESGRVTLAHCDLYRISDPDEMTAMGLFELAKESVTILEWAERGEEEVPVDHVDILIEFDGDSRVLTIEAHGPRSRALTRKWLA